MRAALIGWVVAVLAGTGITDAVAQHSRSRRAPPRSRSEAPPIAVPRPPTTPLRPRGDGIIYWNTPNRDGNLGGPGAGGSSGGS